MHKNAYRFPLDENNDPFYPECQVCPKHPSIADCDLGEICEFEFCDYIVEKYPKDFQGL